MATAQSKSVLVYRVGLFTLAGLMLIAAITVLVNGQPFWWRPCQFVRINVEDASGLKTKSPIRSLGIEIGYLKSVYLSETHVTLGICITAPVDVLPTTRAYIRGEGFLGDKFVELKPVKYTGAPPNGSNDESQHFIEKVSDAQKDAKNTLKQTLWKFWNATIPSASADEMAVHPRATAPPVETAPTQATPDAAAPPVPVAPVSVPPLKPKRGREIPVGAEGQDIQHLVGKVDELVGQMSGLTSNLKQGLDPAELKATLRQLNVTLQNASKTLAPEGGLNQTAQRSLGKLEDAIEQLRDMMTRVNKGEGSIGMLVNDPSYAEEIKLALKNVNRLLNKVAEFRFRVDVGATQVTGYNGGRGWFQLGIWPRPDRYYLLGLAFDPRGKITTTTVITTSGSTSVEYRTQATEQTGILFTAMLGKIFFERFDVSLGALYGDGAGSLNLRLGPQGSEGLVCLRADGYVRNAVGALDSRITLTVEPIHNVYLRAGIESFRGLPTLQPIYLFGAGISFDDEDIKILFALK